MFCSVLIIHPGVKASLAADWLLQALGTLKTVAIAIVSEWGFSPYLWHQISPQSFDHRISYIAVIQCSDFCIFSTTHFSVSMAA